MATVHFIFGPVGAGKTTFGRAFAAEHHALFFCLDEWMAALFIMDANYYEPLDEDELAHAHVIRD